MSFKPSNDRHAIQQVSFIVHLTAPLSQVAADAIAASHQDLRADLPKLERPSVFAFQFSEDGVGVPPEIAAPVVMKSFRRDGSIDWELFAQESSVAINCFSYTRWDDIWSRARRYLAKAFEVDAATKLSARSIVLHYVDVFDAESDTYDLDTLIKSDSSYVPAQVRDKGILWHSHQGWFETDTEIGEFGRILHRVEFAGLRTARGPVVKADHMQELRFATPLAGLSESFADTQSHVVKAMKRLHARNKEFCASFLTEEMQNRVSLNG